MKTWQAILLTLAIIVLNVLLKLPILVMYIIVFGTAIWAAIDSSKIQLKKYKTGIALSPIVLFIGIALLWIVGFPWYLSVRYKIKHGTLPLKEAQSVVPNNTQPQ